MIEQAYTQTQIQPQAESQAQKPRKVFRMVENERMGGSMPVWETAKTTKQKVEEGLSLAENGIAAGNFAEALSYAQGIEVEADESFGFGDIIDMVNPLQHIPLVNTAYRELTGDEIKPIGKIIGGAVFGGPVGAGSGLVNAAIEEETGKDITGNAMAMVTTGDMPRLKSNATQPEQRLNAAAKTNREELPASLLAFTAPTQATGKSGIVIERLDSFRVSSADVQHTRKALDTFRIDVKENMNSLPPREPVSEIKIERVRGYN